MRAYDLNKTPLMQRTMTREFFGEIDLDELIASLPVEERVKQRPSVRPYGARINRGRWLDMRSKLPSWVLAGDYRLSDAVCAVLFTLFRDMRGNGEVRIAYKAISAYAGVSVKTVERAVAHLEEMRFIQVSHGKWSSRLKRKTTNLYRIANKNLMAWWQKRFRPPTDIHASNPKPERIPVSTVAQQWKWGAATREQTELAQASAEALGRTGDPWMIALEVANDFAFRGYSKLVEKHQFNGLLAVYQVALKVMRKPGAITSPRGYLRSLLSMETNAYRPAKSISYELQAREMLEAA